MSSATLATKDAVNPIIHKGYLGELADAYISSGMDRKDPRVSRSMLICKACHRR